MTAAPPKSPGWRWDNTYPGLPEIFFSRTRPHPVRAPRLAVLNEALARDLGLDPDALAAPEHSPVFAGNLIPPGAEPLAQAYAGHQFGHFTTLGDGRAVLLGEHLAPDGRRVDIQLKGGGITPYSRGGDGRAAFGPMLREYIISEAMHALGIPTTRSLAVAITGEPVFRDETLAGAVLTRVAASHIRVGTFQWAAATGDPAALQALTTYTLHRHFPESAGEANPALALLGQTARRQATLVALWMGCGFVHGVMNTDNMSIPGETIDYGPCAFIDAYDPGAVFSSIDRRGRYAFGNQPDIARWNIARLAEALLPLLDPTPDRAIDLAHGVLDDFTTTFQRAWLDVMRGKLGLTTADEGDASLINALLEWMAAGHHDFTHTFRLLSAPGTNSETLANDPAFREWHASWRKRASAAPLPDAERVSLMRSRNPAAIPRNHLVEQALTAATHGDLTPLRGLLAAVTRPYDEGHPATYTDPPPPGLPPYQTFCGT